MTLTRLSDNMKEDQKEALNVRTRRKVLEELIKKGNSTAYGLAKRVDISDSAVGRHLDILEEAALVEPPYTDTSVGRLKKIYTPAKNAEEVLAEFWEKELDSIPDEIRKKVNK